MAQTLTSLNVNDYFAATFTTGAAAAIPTTSFFIAPFACKVVSNEVSWGVAAGATSTIGLYKDPSLTAAGAGTIILAAAVDFNTTADTSAAPALSATAADYTFAAGDKLSIKVATGTATASARVVWTVIFQRI